MHNTHTRSPWWYIFFGGLGSLSSLTPRGHFSLLAFLHFLTILTTFLVSAYIHREPKILVERYKFLSPNRLEELSTFTLSLDLESQEIVVSYSREILSYAFYYCYYILEPLIAPKMILKKNGRHRPTSQK